jgi:hypothetical protein
MTPRLEIPADETLLKLFRQWLAAFDAVVKARGDQETVAEHEALAAIEARIAATPAEGVRGLVVKLGLHQFLNDSADPGSIQVNSAYCDLVRLTGHNPATEISARFKGGEEE